MQALAYWCQWGHTLLVQEMILVVFLHTCPGWSMLVHHCQSWMDIGNSSREPRVRDHPAER